MRIVPSLEATPSSVDVSLGRTGTRLRAVAPEAPVRVGLLAHLGSLVLALPVGLATAMMLLFVRLEEE